MRRITRRRSGATLPQVEHGKAHRAGLGGLVWGRYAPMSGDTVPRWLCWVWLVRDISYTRTYSDAAQGHALALTTRPDVHPWDAAVAARRILDQLDLTGTTL